MLEAHKGVIATFFPNSFDAARLLDYGKPWRVVDPGLAIKLFPSQYGTHYAITAGLDIHAQAGGAERIRQVRIVSPVMKYIDRPQPATGLDVHVHQRKVGGRNRPGIVGPPFEGSGHTKLGFERVARSPGVGDARERIGELRRR